MENDIICNGYLVIGPECLRKDNKKCVWWLFIVGHSYTETIQIWNVLMSKTNVQNV